MQSARGRNVRLLHLAGHGNRRCGFFWLKSSAVSTEYEEVPNLYLDNKTYVIKSNTLKRSTSSTRIPRMEAFWAMSSRTSAIYCKHKFEMLQGEYLFLVLPHTR